MKRGLFIVALAMVALIAFPTQMYPRALRVWLAETVGAGDYVPLPATRSPVPLDPEPRCPPDPAGWRDAQTVDGVSIRAAQSCVADDPAAVAAFVRGTNRVSHETLMAAGLAPDAVVKGDDLDGDGDPDQIHIRLEVVELNGASPDVGEPVTQYAIAPGIKPGLWVFAPKTTGMATVNFESPVARAMLRLPSPVIRVEQGDEVTITLENSHYLPHTIHFHGVDHSFLDAAGQGNDGVPIASEMPVMPGSARAYELSPRHAGTMFYHCHVQPQVHIMMGLSGLFVVAPNLPDNTLQTLNVGAGFVRAPSVSATRSHDAEYDLHYLDIDRELNERIQASNDPRLIARSLHREYNITQATYEYYTLNGRSFPYTFRESLIHASADQRIRLRVLNGGTSGLALHTHGHKATVTAWDGVNLEPAARVTRDVFWLASAQRMDLLLETNNDGLHSYGPGIWLMHDHQGKGTTTDGINPGGNISAIVYDEFRGVDGWPETRGMNWDLFFTEEYYRKEIPVWREYADQLLGDPLPDTMLAIRLVIAALAGGMALAMLIRVTVGER